MDPGNLLNHAGWHRDSFQLIKDEQFDSLGIDPEDIPLGTIPALRHPAQLPSRFGGNAYGAGIYELFERLGDEELTLLQHISTEDPQQISKHYKAINRLYKKLGLLIRFTRFGKPYYLIPTHVVTNTLLSIRSKIEEVSKIINYHRKKFFKEHQSIGVVSHTDDILVQELSLRFKEHEILVIDSLNSLVSLEQIFDLFVLTRDPYEILLLDKFSPSLSSPLSRKTLNKYTSFLLWNIYKHLKAEGEIFIIANHHVSKTGQTAQVRFKTPEEEKNFLLFSHIFKTRKRYHSSSDGMDVNIFDFQKYLSGLYVEQEVLDKLLKGRDLDSMKPQDISLLPYLNFDLQQWPFSGEQEKRWSQLLSPFFDKIFLKPLLPQFVKEHWEERFSCKEYQPTYMLIYMGQKKIPQTNMAALKKDVEASRLTGSSFHFMAEYRDTFKFLIETLQVLNRLKNRLVNWEPKILLERLIQPLQNKARRHTPFTHVLKLMAKVKKLQKIEQHLNPSDSEKKETSVVDNLEALSLFGFNDEELKEILYIVLGHTSMGHIISGKMPEISLKPLTDKARTLELPDNLNLLRYIRLMTMAELVAARSGEFKPEQLTELFELYESAVSLVTNKDLTWDNLIDDKIATRGGVKHEVVRKLLKMMDLYQFLSNWWELPYKGTMEKEALANYDPENLAKIQKVIQLLETIEQFESTHLQALPHEMVSFYRKLLRVEFHGTGRLFSRLGSKSVFTLLWTTVNVLEGKIINFNPFLSDLEDQDLDKAITRIETEISLIKLQYLGISHLRELSIQLYQKGTTFVVGTGIQLRIDNATKSLELKYVDIDGSINQMARLLASLSGEPLSKISVDLLRELERLFSDLENFYQSHIYLLSLNGKAPNLPSRHRRWFENIKDLRVQLRTNFLGCIFRQGSIHTNLSLLHDHAPSLLSFILPEFIALKKADLSTHVYMTSPVTKYILASTRKLQALVNKDRKAFHDLKYLHQLAKLEFGPMTAGTVGINDSQLQQLEAITDRLVEDKPLFNALLRAMIFQDIARIPQLREKYKDELHPADLSEASVTILEKEDIAKRYGLDKVEEEHLKFLVRHHGLIHHIIRGEFSPATLQTVLRESDRARFEAFFLFSLVMLSAIREDLMLEDLAEYLFRLRGICLHILERKTTLDDYLHDEYRKRGLLYFSLKSKAEEGATTLAPQKVSTQDLIDAGRMIFAMERLFRLHGIRYVLFSDISELLLNKSIRLIYKRRRFSSIGYATFEKELFEALRIYNTLQRLPEPMRHFVLERLSNDIIRICGYEKVSRYLNYQNQIKLMFISLMGTERVKSSPPIYINFLPLSGKVERRYESLNDYLASFPLEEAWLNRDIISALFKNRKGLILKSESRARTLSIDFKDKIDIEHKLSYMERIDNSDQLKNYFYYSLRSLRNHPFFTEDYERLLEKAYENRLKVITEEMVERIKEQMNLINDFNELHQLVEDIMTRSLEIGLNEEQKHRLTDIYEIRKEQLKKEKLLQIYAFLNQVRDEQELKDYWETIKWYLQENRPFLGRDFELLVARSFDATMERIAKDGTW